MRWMRLSAELCGRHADRRARAELCQRFRDEASNLMPDDPRSAKLKTQTMLLGEFLVRHAPDYRPAQTQRKMLLHVHCHQRAIFNVKDEIAVLGATGGDVKMLDSGCCGMAGPFRVRAEELRRVADPRRAGVAAGGSRRGRRQRSSSPTGSAAASRSRRTPTGARCISAEVLAGRV